MALSGMSMNDEPACLIVDVGADSCRLGCAGEDVPRCVLQASSMPDERPWLSYNDSGIAVFDADALAAVLETSNNVVARRQPLQESDSPLSVLVSEPVLRRRSARALVGEVLFERLQAPSVAFCNTAALSACAFGVLDAMVVDVGAGLSFAAPVVDGWTRAQQMRAEPFAGRALDLALQDALRQQGVELSKSSIWAPQRLAQDLKEAVCFCSHRPLAKMDKAEPFFHTLPDGQKLDAAAFSRAVPEKLLMGCGNPGGTFLGLPTLFDESAALCKQQGLPHLNDVLLVGGSSLFVNLKSRFESALSSAPRSRAGRFQVHSSRERRHAAWLGGSVLACTGCAEWFLREAYQEHGASFLEERSR